jgi:hypothetical protein
MNNFFYFLRQKDKSKMPRVTVCLLYRLSEDKQTIKVFARGIAICSLKETPIKYEGIRLSHCRAVEAFTEKANLFEINENFVAVKKALNTIYASPDQAIYGTRVFKACYNPTLTRYEENLLHKMIEKEKNKC